MQIDNIRHRFPIFKSKTFINSCSKGALSVDVQDAYADYLRDWAELGSPWEHWVEQLEVFRGLVADLLNAETDEIGVTTSVSASVNALASALDFSGERNEVVVDDFAFPTTAQIWHAQERRGAIIKHVPERQHEIPLEFYEHAITDKTLILSLTHVCYRNGVRQDVAEIIKLAHEKGALVLLDSYQLLGTMPFDVMAARPDFLVGGTLKYLLGSSGLAFIYSRKSLIPTLFPQTSGWFSQENIFAMDIYQNDPALSARRFEAGTPPNPNLYAGIAGLKLVQEIGLETIDAHRLETTGAIKEGAQKHGFRLVTKIDPRKSGPMITLASNDPAKLTEQLAEDGIIVSHRENNLRLSPHIYNNLADVDRLMAGLVKHRVLLS
ncbi:MAG: aminotransferase class V-fold PLP-dependent enzyme [Chloroflexota bacterium]